MFDQMADKFEKKLNELLFLWGKELPRVKILLQAAQGPQQMREMTAGAELKTVGIAIDDVMRAFDEMQAAINKPQRYSGFFQGRQMLEDILQHFPHA